MPNDFLLDIEGDLQMAEGDLLWGEATEQHQRLLLVMEKGQLREFPTRGVGLNTWLLEDSIAGLNGAIKREFEADGMTVNLVNVRNGALQIEAFYE